MNITHLHDLLDPEELAWLMTERRISKQAHPDLPISIYNYTALAQFKNEWTNAERVCRGLIVNDESNMVIARGPSKFFNYGQPGAPETDLDSLVRVTRKMDGSLGIGWFAYGHFGVATRGSFKSEQAIHATELLSDDQRWDIEMNPNQTLVWEIIYPSNRIVVDYGQTDVLHPLGMVDNESGLIEYRSSWVDDVLPTLGPEVITLREALELPIPDDEEGYVLDIVEPRQKFTGVSYDVTGHVKLKGETYKILHGLLTNTNARRIWVQLAARDCKDIITDPQQWGSRLGHDPADFERVDVSKGIEETLLTNVPDEFYDWVTRKIDSINDTVSDLISQSIMYAGQLSLIEDKKTRYELVKHHPMAADILSHANSTDPSNIDRLTLKAWKLAKPEGDDTPFRTTTDED